MQSNGFSLEGFKIAIGAMLAGSEFKLVPSLSRAV